CSGFTRVTACKVAARPQADSCPEASTRPVTRPDRSVATMSNRQLHRWILLPLAICAVGAHCQPEGSEFETRLGSQIYPLRAFSAFWLTPDKPQRPRMANMWGNRPSPDVRSTGPTRPACRAKRRLGSAFSDSLSRAARLVN